ncbi:hypothetical protein ACJIZ3_007059 [Penstemon smallii]|uniref:Regulatory protein RecX n=1 Tax=Penstemon smallii TaxID=265156 RepID=A0ABD3S9F4_9LAMI
MKYIPKKSLRSKENESESLPGNYLEVNEEHNGLKMNVEKVDFFKNLHERFSDIESKNHGPQLISNINHGVNLEVEDEIEGDFMVASDELIEVHDDVVGNSSKRGHGIETGKTLQDVEKSTIELLANRAYTALELKKKLQGKRYPLEIVDAVITDFQSRGLINDCLYAETYSRSRWSSSSWGPRRIKQALFKKGVGEVDAEKAIKLVFEESSEDDGDHVSGIAMSKLSIDKLYVQASKQWLRSHGAPNETRKSRIVRWLQYRGFDWNTIKFVLKKLESEYPS